MVITKKIKIKKENEGIEEKQTGNRNGVVVQQGLRLKRSWRLQNVSKGKNKTRAKIQVEFRTNSITTINYIIV